MFVVKTYSLMFNVSLFRLNPLAVGLNLNPGLKADTSNKEIEEAMKRVREAQSLISAAIEPGREFERQDHYDITSKMNLFSQSLSHCSTDKDSKKKRSRSRSRSRRRRSRSRSKHR